MVTTTTTPISLHDSLALGEVELGLLPKTQSSSAIIDKEEIVRLPVLLRLLSSARPLSSIPTFPAFDAVEQPNNTSDNDTDDDPVANQVVARLEDVAATYSVAEGVDVVACHLAPSICRKLSRLAPLKRKRNVGSTTTAALWDTKELAIVAANPASRFKRRRGSETYSSGAHNSKATADSDDEIHLATAGHRGDLSEEEQQEQQMMMDHGDAVNTNNYNALEDAGSLHRRSSLETTRGSIGSGASAARDHLEDSQESNATKTLSELATLVVSSLEPIKEETMLMREAESNHPSRGGDSETGRTSGGTGTKAGGSLFLSLAMEDSNLAEPRQAYQSSSAENNVGGVTAAGSSDLGSTVAALMHHAPVLRHRHVASALCRAAIPQAPNLIQRMAANCPTAVPCLLRGCIDAYQRANAAKSRNAQISNAAKAAVRELAKLSQRELSRVLTTLQQEHVMVDVQLELAMMLSDPLIAAYLLLQHLSSSNNTEEVEPTSLENPGKKENYFSVVPRKQLQSPGTALKKLFEEKPALLGKTVKFLHKEIASRTKDMKSSLRLVQLSVLLRAYVCLYLQCEMKEVAQVTCVIPELLDLVVEMKTCMAAAVNAPATPTSHFETPMELLLCASLVSLACVITRDEKGDLLAKEKCELAVEKCFECRDSRKYEVLLVRLGCALTNCDAKGCRQLIHGVVENPVCSQNLVMTSSLNDSFLKICEWASTKPAVQDAVTSCASTGSSPADPSAMLDLVRLAKSNDYKFTSTVQGGLRKLLNDSQLESSILMDENMPEFVVEATQALAAMNSINMPIVSPVQLETLASKVDLVALRDRESYGGLTCQFLCQVLYWFSYLDTETSSICAYDARELPLKEILGACDRLGEDNVLCVRLWGLISKHCPEISFQTQQWESLRHLRVNLANTLSSFDSKRVKQRLYLAVNSCVNDPSSDPSGIMAERLFLIARGKLSDSLLYTTAVSALLSSPCAPAPFITYSMLCRDPLVLLKSPMRVWQCRGLRHILLSTLSCLLESNTAVINEISPTDSCAEDLVSSRNVLIVRCVLIAVSTAPESDPEHSPHMCSMTAHFLRRLIASNRGLVGMLVKQSPALPDSALDWLVEFVPETMDDSRVLANVLSERGSLSSRLTAASAILRIAIAHGHREEPMAESLVYASLAHLVSSFFIIVGPVGVPVNVLVGDGLGTDVTQTSRKLTFRMLRSLLNVRGRQRSRLRNECGMALHKLAGLCKGESILGEAKIGVAGPVVSRRKTLLRDIFEAISKAANNMGCSVEI